MRRRNKPRVVWLPCTNANTADVIDGRSMWQFPAATTLDGATTGSVGALEIPVVQDGTQSSPLDPTASLSDIESSGYRLRRIVGKLYVFITQTDFPGAVFGVTAGFIVRRVDPSTGTSLAANVGVEEINPSDIENGMDPWIWRRSWLLSDNGTVDLTTIADVPGQNFGAQYPGPTEGPHIDQKTARIIGPEERLMLSVSATTLIASGGNTAALVIINELRVLASMRVNSGNRRNASR